MVNHLGSDADPLVLALCWRMMANLNLVPLKPVGHRGVLDIVVIRQHRLDLIEQCNHLTLCPLYNHGTLLSSNQRPLMAAMQSLP